MPTRPPEPQSPSHLPSRWTQLAHSVLVRVQVNSTARLVLDWLMESRAERKTNELDRCTRAFEHPEEWRRSWDLPCRGDEHRTEAVWCFEHARKMLMYELRFRQNVEALKRLRGTGLMHQLVTGRRVERG